MSEQTNIEWCDSTFNPWTGCTKVSPGCDNCYAEGWAQRSGLVQWGPHADRRRTSVKNWNQPLRWEREHEKFASENSGRRRRVFCASLADVFDNTVPVEWRIDLFRLIAATPHLDWLLVTKRIGNVPSMLAEVEKVMGCGTFPMPNVWLGISVVNQEEANRDIPKLLSAPAAVRFLSMEPLLGPVDLLSNGDRLCRCPGCLSMARENPEQAGLQRIDWVIVGGESGPKARPTNPAWVASLRDQCASAGVPFLFKQWGEWMPTERDGNMVLLHFDNPEHTGPNEPAIYVWRDDAVMARTGKKAAGRRLDGQEHNGMPQPRPVSPEPECKGQASG